MCAVYFDDDDVYYYIRWRLKLEGETENMCVCTKERKGVAAAVLMATPCTNSLGGESGGHKHEGCEGRSACWKYAAVSGSGAGLLGPLIAAVRRNGKAKSNREKQVRYGNLFLYGFQVDNGTM